MIFLLLFLIQDEVPADGWVQVQPPRIGAKIEMPSLPSFKEQEITPVRDLPPITVRTRSAMMPGGKANLTFVYHDEANTPSSRRQVQAVLNGAVNGAIALVNGHMVKENEIFIKNHKGRDFVYRSEIDDVKFQTKHKIKIRTRIILVKNRLFSLNYIAEEDAYDDKTASRYFESFELVKTADDLPPKPRAGRARELAKDAN